MSTTAKFLRWRMVLVLIMGFYFSLFVSLLRFEDIQFKKICPKCHFVHERWKCRILKKLLKWAILFYMVQSTLKFSKKCGGGCESSIFSFSSISSPSAYRRMNTLGDVFGGNCSRWNKFKENLQSENEQKGRESFDLFSQRPTLVGVNFKFNGKMWKRRMIPKACEKLVK